MVPCSFPRELEQTPMRLPAPLRALCAFPPGVPLLLSLRACLASAWCLVGRYLTSRSLSSFASTRKEAGCRCALWLPTGAALPERHELALRLRINIALQQCSRLKTTLRTAPLARFFAHDRSSPALGFRAEYSTPREGISRRGAWVDGRSAGQVESGMRAATRGVMERDRRRRE